MARSTIYDPFVGEAPYTLWVDAQMTKRKTHSIVIDSADQICFRSRLTADAIDWLANQDQTVYTVITGPERFRCRMTRLPAKKGKRK